MGNFYEVTVMKKQRKTPTGYETSIVDGFLYYEDCKQCHMKDEVFTEMIGDGYTKAIRVVSLDQGWFEKVYLTSDTFIKSDINAQMTLRAEIRSGRRHWYAYRRVFGRLYKKYVGTDEKVTQMRLLEIARAMPST
jgi:hypothetical protein